MQVLFALSKQYDLGWTIWVCLGDETREAWGRTLFIKAAVRMANKLVLDSERRGAIEG